jgi:hypothetical protein
MPLDTYHCLVSCVPGYHGCNRLEQGECPEPDLLRLDGNLSPEEFETLQNKYEPPRCSVTGYRRYIASKPQKNLHVNGSPVMEMGSLERKASEPIRSPRGFL